MLVRPRVAIARCFALTAPAFAWSRRAMPIDDVIDPEHYTDFTIQGGVARGHRGRLGV